MSEFRQERLDTLLKQNITKIIQKDIRDKRIKRITIEDVKVSPDLRNADVYFSLQNVKNRKSTIIALNKGEKYLRRKLAQILNLRHTPKLKFIYDILENDAFSIEELIENEGKKYDT